MTRIELTGTPDEKLSEWLRLMIDFRAEHGSASLTEHGYAYSCAEDFIVQHGEHFPAERFQYVQGAPRACYGNSIVLATMHGWTYVEGYALTPHDLVVMHAWCVKPDGTPVECTWPEPPHGMATAYRGVRFSTGRADDATWTGDACVLDDWQRQHPLFREPWRGEDWDREWPKSDSPLRSVFR